MSSPEFPTYGRGDDPDEPESKHYAKPTPYGTNSPYSAPPGQQPPAQPYPGQQYPGQQPPAQQYPGQPQQAPYGETSPATSSHPATGPATPTALLRYPQPHELPSYGRDQRPAAPRDPRAARVVLLALVIAAVYGLLVISVQRVSIREIAQLPGSPLNHPLRTDVIDTIGQLLILLVGAAALVMWLRDVMHAARSAASQTRSSSSDSAWSASR